MDTDKPTRLDDEERIVWELQCYGTTVEALAAELEDSLTVKIGGGYGMAAISLLSDAQHMIEVDEYNRARQYINCAKWIISHHLMPQ